MNTIFLCSGMETRLRETIEYKAKSMVKKGDKPNLWHIMKYYAHYGFKDSIHKLE